MGASDVIVLVVADVVVEDVVDGVVVIVSALVVLDGV